MDNWPAEIWMEVCKLLTPEDLYRLRLCSSKLNRIVCDCTDIWCNLCNKKWLTIESSDPIVHSECRSNVVSPSSDWFYYYRYRSNIDAKLEKKLQKLVEVEEMEEFWETFWSFFRYKRFLIPFLQRHTEKGYVRSAKFKSHCISKKLLTAVRHGIVFRCIDGLKDSSGDSYGMSIVEETLYFPLSAMDPCFDKLLVFRTTFFDRVHFLLKRAYPNIDKFCKLPDTIRADKLVTYIWQVFQERAYYVPNSQRCHLEDIMLLRIYSGEARGHPMLLMAIIQAVVSRYGVETRLCEQVLIIIDKKLRGGQSYLMISLRNDGRPRIFTRNRLMETMGRTVANFDASSAALHKFLTPLTFKMGVEKFFKDLSTYCDRSVWKTFADHSPESILKYLPNSCAPMDEAVFEYFVIYWKVISASLATNAIFHTVLSKQFQSLIVKQHPGDAIHFPDRREALMHSITKMSFRESISEHVSMQHIHRVPEMGHIVRQKNTGILSVVIGGKKTDKDTYLVIVDIVGKYNVVHGDDVEIYEDFSWDIMLKLMSASDLGVYFEGWDKKSNCLLLSKQLQDIITAG
ncbi:HBL370Cp [Eremothecium sinecaudum]|uniref:HBL370Cp n=1 Tax=Eremothecium sinecaudum TaxID=45286 RepID=A0A109UWN9_9SACH|nr:HBL370Cp [Eremothecium sinecaudum]AMD18532.1 HBL370Cp [Eremothecium sinecaudum]